MTGIRVLAAGVTILLAGCEGRGARTTGADTTTPTLAVATGDTTRRLPSVPVSPLHIGRRATAAEVRAWDIDVNGAGVGLPPGKGTYERGAGVFAQQCAACHGMKGEGLATNPRLVGAEPRDFSFALDPKVPKTIGNYWPYATTLYDYIKRAMPFNAPGSLPPDDVYSLVAFLLAENGIIGRGVTMDAASLPKVQMPARERFVRDDRAGGPTFR